MFIAALYVICTKGSLTFQNFFLGKLPGWIKMLVNQKSAILIEAHLFFFFSCFKMLVTFMLYDVCIVL